MSSMKKSSAAKLTLVWVVVALFLVNFTIAGGKGPACDLTGDSSCDIADLDTLAGGGATAINDWLAGAATENGYGSPYLGGDTDLDRDVDLSDYNALAGNFNPAGSGGLPSQGDIDGDGDVDLSDYNTLAGNFAAAGYAGAAGVPEPSSMVLCMLGLVFGSGIAFCRKRLWS